MSDRELRFVNEYVICLNATDAARRAGYAHPSVTGCKMLKKTHITQAIAAATAPLAKKYGVEAEDVIEQLHHVLTRTAMDFVDKEGQLLPVSKMNARAQACIDGFEQDVLVQRDNDGEEVSRILKTKIKLASKVGAIDMALRHKGLFPKEAPPSGPAVTIINVLPNLLKEAEKNRNVIDGEVIQQKAINGS